MWPMAMTSALANKKAIRPIIDCASWIAKLKRGGRNKKKAAAAMNGQTLKDFIIECLERAVADDKPERRPPGN